MPMAYDTSHTLYSLDLNNSSVFHQWLHNPSTMVETCSFQMSSESIQESCLGAGALGAVFRTVLETMRTLFVWLVDLLLFYTPLGFGTLGESWSKYSFVQAAG